MSKTKSKPGSRLLRAGIATAAVTAAVVATAAAPAMAVSVPLTLSSSVGPAATANTVTATAATSFLAGVASPRVTLSLPTCQTLFNATASAHVTPTTATAGNIVTGVTATKLTDNKLMIATPTTVILSPPGTATTTKYNVCVYSGGAATDTLVGTASYSVATAIGLTSISPASGPARGGTMVTVTGTAFPTTKGAITGTLGGTAIENVTPVNGTSFTFTTPYHAPSTTAVSLNVTTAAGTQTLSGVYTYANGINIAPNTGPNTATAVFVDILGAGFSSLTWSTTPLPTATPTGARVELVPGVYTTTDASSSGTYNGGVAECASVIPISDGEVICSMNLKAAALDATDATATPASRIVPNGTYTLTVVADSDPAAVITDAMPTDLSSGSTFTVAPY
jgi:hypothetical protein